MTNIHTKIESYIELYLDNNLTPNQEAELKSHVNTCDDCRAKFNDSVLAHEELNLHLAGVGPDAMAVERIITNIHAKIARRKLVSFGILGELFALRPLTIVALAVLLLAIGLMSEGGLLPTAARRQAGVDAAHLGAVDETTERDSHEQGDATTSDAPPPNRDLKTKFMSHKEQKSEYGGSGNIHLGEAGSREGRALLPGKESDGSNMRKFDDITRHDDQKEQPGERTGSGEYNTPDGTLKPSLPWGLDGEGAGDNGEPKGESARDGRSRGKSGALKDFEKQDQKERRNEMETSQDSRPAVRRDQKIIKTGYVTVEVDSFEKTYQAIRSLVGKYDGYIQSAQTNIAGNKKVRGTVVVRIPAETFDEILESIKGLGRLLDINTASQDVTKQYTDLQSKLKALRIMESNLLKLLEQKAKVKELLEIERELGRVRGELETIEGSIRYYDNVTSYSTISITVKEKGVDDPSEYIQTMSGNMVLRVGNVHDTFKQLTDHCAKSKVRVVQAHRTEDANQNNGQATIRALIDSDKAADFMNEIKRFDVAVESSQLQKNQTPRSGRPYDSVDGAADETYVKKEMAIIDIYLYVKQKRDVGSGQISIRTQDPDQLFTELKTRLPKDFNAEILNANIYEGQQNQKNAYVYFEVAPEVIDGVATYLRSRGEVTNLQINRNPIIDTDGNLFRQSIKVNLQVQPPSGRFELSQTAAVSIKQSDPKKAFDALKEIATASGASVVSSSYNSSKDVSTGNLQLQVEADKFNDLINKLKGIEGVEDVKLDEVKSSAGVDPTSALTPPLVKMPGTVNVTITNREKIVDPGKSIYNTIVAMLRGSFEGLLKSLLYIVKGAAIVIPWLIVALLLFLGYRKYKNGRKAAAAGADTTAKT